MPTNFHHVCLAALQYVPRPIIWRISSRYIAGVGLEDAFRVVRRLNAQGCSATIDVLGEDSTRAEQVDASRDLYLEAIRQIRSAAMQCGISVKLSEMGLRFDVRRCSETMSVLVSCAGEYGNFVRIDMEDSSVTDVTLDIYRELRSRFDNVGIAIQACLRRSAGDIAGLLRDGPTDVRLCKGIYVESESIAFREPEDIRSSYRELLEQLLGGGAKRVGIATHDPALVRHAEDTITHMSIPRERYEFQMLLGVAGPLRKDLVGRGHPVRVYVPFGELWFAYAMRRLRENPHIAGHIFRNFLQPD